MEILIHDVNIFIESKKNAEKSDQTFTKRNLKDPSYTYHNWRAQHNLFGNIQF